MLHTLQNITSVGDAQPTARYTLLCKLPSGLRSDIWLATDAANGSLDELVALKVFVPHGPGPRLDNLRRELDLAGKLSHANVVSTLQVGFEAGSHFIVNEYLYGRTLEALLHWTKLAGVRIANAAVARVLSALLAVVDHAARLSHTAGARLLSRQAIGVEDVFITYDGAVKLLGLKMQPLAAPAGSWSTATSSPLAVDALLSDHWTPELGAVLARAMSAPLRPLETLKRMGEALQTWQTQPAGSDGQAELVSLMKSMPMMPRLDLRARLDAALGNAQAATWPQRGEETAPVSGFRRVATGYASKPVASTSTQGDRPVHQAARAKVRRPPGRDETSPSSCVLSRR
jgi:hypothetical protein